MLAEVQQLALQVDPYLAADVLQHVAPQPRPSRRPVRHQQPGHARELADVCRHQSCATAARLGRDEIIIVSDRRALALQIGADVAGMRGVFRIERKDRDGETKKSLEQMFVMVAPITLGEPLAHFEQRDRRQCDRHACAHLFSEAVAKR